MAWRIGSSRIAQGTVTGSTEIACDYPTGAGVIELVNDGPITWADPRVVRDVPFWPYCWALVFLVLTRLAWTRRGPELRGPAFETATRFAVFKVAAATVSLAAALLVSEVALRALGDSLPRGITTERHDLGEVTADPHWVDSPRYGRRLRASVDTLNEWREGDIIRMGFMPPPATPGPLHRFSFHTDAEGFRNQAVREQFEIAALGDSFTDAMTMAAEDSWPSQLERLTGAAVQNYGTAGFGPSQQLLVLKEVIAPHRPRTVVLAFFAGNDIFDAEAFERFQQSGGVVRREAQGWRIKSVVSRVDTWFVTSALRAGGNWLAARSGAVSAAEPEPPLPVAAPVEAPSAAAPAFDRGTFSVPVNGRLLQWAFMPPYLNTLNFSREQLEARSGWRLTREAIAEMQTVSRSFGARFVVMFVPFKSQVYLPLIKNLPPELLRSAIGFSVERYGRGVDVERLYANRLAQNQMMERFCAEAGIPFLDLTPALEARVATGNNMYFPDESHLNEAGEALLAERLAIFLATLPDRR